MEWLIRELDAESFWFAVLIVAVILILGFCIISTIAEKKQECYYIDSSNNIPAVKAFVPWDGDPVIFTSQNISEVIQIYDSLGAHCIK